MGWLEERSKQVITDGARWLAQVARVQSQHNEFEDTRSYPSLDYSGAIRNEYDTRTRKWFVNGPVWHTGQAIRAVLIAYRHTADPSLLEASVDMGRYIVRNIVDSPGDPNHGLLLAYEGDNITVNNQTVFETLPGLMDLAQVLDDSSWVERARRAADFVLNGGYLPDEGLIIDHYHVDEARFVGDADNPLPGRPLVDDAAFYQLAQAAGEDRYTQIFLTIAERAVREENPPGTWIVFPPWHQRTGRVHIRTSWWWGYPLLTAYDITQDVRFWEASLRVGEWYLAQQNLDGGFYYSPLISGKHTSFGLATSGAAVASIIWCDLFTRTGDKKYKDAINRSVRFLLAAQFSQENDDPNIRGALWESPNAPDGTGYPGSYIRDIATIFAIRALDKVLSIEGILEEGEVSWDSSMPW